MLKYNRVFLLRKALCNDMNIPTVYTKLKHVVTTIYHKLKLQSTEHTVGRPTKLSTIDSITLSIYKQASTRSTKKSVYEDFKQSLTCSYKTLVVSMNRCVTKALLIVSVLLRINCLSANTIKHTDLTDIPVCLNKNAKNHKTMKGLAAWGHSGKGLFYGVKLHMTTDVARRIIKIKFAGCNVHNTKMFIPLNDTLTGIFIADSGYLSKKMKELFENEDRIMIVRPRKNMKQLSAFEWKLYKTRMKIELNFRSLKMFHGLISSLPRSINGYLSNFDGV